MTVQIPPRRICTPNATQIETPEPRSPRSEPYSSFRGKLSETQSAIANCPVTAKTRAKSVAAKTGVEGNPIRIESNVVESKISKGRITAYIKFFASRTSRKRTGAVK